MGSLSADSEATQDRGPHFSGLSGFSTQPDPEGGPTGEHLIELSFERIKLDLGRIFNDIGGSNHDTDVT